MPSLFELVWNISLATAVMRRIRKLQVGEEWREVAAGPAEGVKLLLPVPLEPWGHEMINGVYDRFLYDTISRHRNMAGVRVWDIGAHIGYHSLSLANQGAQVVAFEPGSANVSRLRLHLEHNNELARRIRVVAAAMADRDGEMAFIVSSDLTGRSSGSHLAEATPPLNPARYSRFERTVVRSITIDTLVEKQGEPPPEIIKIDVEGAEHLVLQGGRKTLARYKPLLLVEVHHICVMFSVSRFLVELGYQAELLQPEHATPSRCFLGAW